MVLFWRSARRTEPLLAFAKAAEIGGGFGVLELLGSGLGRQDVLQAGSSW